MVWLESDHFFEWPQELISIEYTESISLRNHTGWGRKCKGQQEGNDAHTHTRAHKHTQQMKYWSHQYTVDPQSHFWAEMEVLNTWTKWSTSKDIADPNFKTTNLLSVKNPLTWVSGWQLTDINNELQQTWTLLLCNWYGCCPLNSDETVYFNKPRLFPNPYHTNLHIIFFSC